MVRDDRGQDCRGQDGDKKGMGMGLGPGLRERDVDGGNGEALYCKLNFQLTNHPLFIRLSVITRP